MCHFHSFVWLNGDRFVEESGEICHYKILTNAKIDGGAQPTLLPEFNVLTRRLEVDGLSYVSFMKKHSDSVSLEPFRSRHARNKLKRYLKRRFGSPRSLVEFAEDYWDLACCQLESLIGQLPTRKLSQSDLQELTKPLITTGPGSPSLISNVDWEPPKANGQQVLHLNMNLGAELGIDEDVIFTYSDAKKLSAKLTLFNKAYHDSNWYNVWLAFYRDGQYVTHGYVLFWRFFTRFSIILESAVPNGRFLPIHEIRQIKREILLRDKYNEWKKLFLKPENRVQVWNLPFDFAYVIGSKNTPRGISSEVAPPSYC